MANVNCVPLKFIFSGGQGIKIYSLMCNVTMANGYLIP